MKNLISLLSFLCTSPHVGDPKFPGAVDEILNLGECWNDSGFAKDRNKIIDTIKLNSNTYKEIYNYIKSAKLIHDNWIIYNSNALNTNKLNLLKKDLYNEIFRVSSNGVGTERHLFITAFTPNGIVTYANELCKNYKFVYTLNGGPGTGKSNIINYLKNKAIEHGLSVEVFHQPLEPSKIEHLLIPSLSTAILTSNEINKIKLEGTQIFMEDILDKNYLSENNSDIEFIKNNFYTILNKGISSLKKTKKIHDEIEEYYIGNMDFDKVDKKFDLLLQKILEYEHQCIK